MSKMLGKVRLEEGTLFVDCGFCDKVLFKHKVDPDLDTAQEVGVKFMLSADFDRHMKEQHSEEIGQGLAKEWIDTPPSE